MRRLAPPLLAAGALVLAAPHAAPAQEEGAVRKREVVGHINEPRKLEPTDEAVAGLKVPEGFKVAKFADGLKNPRIIAVADDGTVYVTRRDIGDVVMLRDADGDWKADERRVVAARPRMHGIAIQGRKAYLATVEDVYAAEIRDDGTLSDLERIIDDLPDSGQHPNRTLAVGPDGALYITVGSTCNACDESSPESATVLRASPDGKQRRIFASGLRNTIGFDWRPGTGQLWAMDMGIDWLGDDDQPEELNRIEEGKNYGWPYIYADGRENPQDEPPGEVTAEQWRRTSEQPALMYTAHASPLQLAFYDGGQFPPEYRGDAFVTFRGSWNRREPSGYEVARVRFGADGQPRAFEPFLTGFVRALDGGADHGFIGRPAGLAVAKDGSLLVGDDTNGVIYRVSYEGGDASAAAAAPAEPPRAGGRVAVGVETPEPKPGTTDDQGGPTAPAIEELRAEGTKALAVTSAAFADGGPLPGRFTAHEEDFSPPLAWSAGPEGTRSYAVLVEDPDAKNPTPAVHWVAHDIPAAVTSLREGLPGAPRLTEPEGVLQGRSTYGSLGWRGPKPPLAGAAHRYRFQVFALDRESLGLDPGASRTEVLNAMRGRVLAAGEVVGLYPSEEAAAR